MVSTHAAVVGMNNLTLPPPVAIERHEFLVTYEGPFHSSPTISPSSSNRKSYCITLPPSGADPRDGLSYVSSDDLMSSLSGKVGWPSFLLCIARRRQLGQGVVSGDRHRCRLLPTRSLQIQNQNAAVTATIIHHQHPPLTVTISPRHSLLRGGKGGFGTLLKGQSKQAGARATLDFGACRDLSGRRLRHVNDEIKLRKFRELQERRERGEEVDELAALKTPSGIRNWHLMVPSWSEGAAFTNKGRRRIERQLEREVRGWHSKEERIRREKEEKRADEEWAMNEYVRRAEVEGGRVGVDMKRSILEHLKKRKNMDKKKKLDVDVADCGETTKTASSAIANVFSGKNSSLNLDDTSGVSSGWLASHLLTLSGEMSVFHIPGNNKESPVDKKTFHHRSVAKLRIQSQSDFPTAVLLLDAAKLKDLSKLKQGIYIEYIIQTAGLAQIGWIRSSEDIANSKSSVGMFLPNSDTGDGVGDDGASYGYDGSRGLKFHDGQEVAYGCTIEKNERQKPAGGCNLVGWKTGDVLGCYCRFVCSNNNTTDCKEGTIEIGYLLNGADTGVAFTIESSGHVFGYYPAASLNLNEVVDVNVGPGFAFDIKEGCIGAFELAGDRASSHAGCNSRDGEGDSAMEGRANSKLNGNDAANDDGGRDTLRKRPRQEPADESAKKEKEEPLEQGHGDPSDHEGKKFNLKESTSVDEIKEMGLGKLRDILLSMGVKCGGTLDERANRLFSLKGLPRQEYPKKVRGKNFIP